MKELIIFDMDGTLVDSSLTIVNAINTVRKNLSLEPMDAQQILKKINDPHLNPALYFYEAKTFTPEHEKWFATYYTNHHEEELRLYQGIENLIMQLKEKGYKLAVATNAYRNSTLQSLSHLNILQHFDALACYDDVAHGKPQPDMLKKLLTELHLSTKETLFIGDGDRDKLAAEAINMDYLMVNWGFSDHNNAIQSIEKLHKSIMEF